MERNDTTHDGGARKGLERFLTGQEFGYGCALREIRSGKKENHWIWYVFPQLRGLGRSPNAVLYGIDGTREAREYLAHPVLGRRLREVSEALLMHRGRDIDGIMSWDDGFSCVVPGLDSCKVRSCMTLFDAICPDDVFARVLEAFFKGERDPLTLEMIRREEGERM